MGKARPFDWYAIPTRKNSEVDTEEALSWTGLSQENNDEEWLKLVGDVADERHPRYRVFENHWCNHVGWVTLWNGSGNGSVKMTVRPRGREGTECLVVVLVQFDEVAMQIFQEDTVCVASDEADTC